MNSLKEKDELLPPYVSYKSLSNFLEGLSQGIPRRIDRSLMPTLSGALQGQIINALRYLSLIDDEGNGTESLNRLVKSQRPERQQILQVILKSSYPFLFNDFDLASATPLQFEQKFRETGATGDTVRRCASFFTYAAKEAEIPLSPYIEKLSRQRSNSYGSSKPKRTRTSAEKTEQVQHTNTVPTSEQTVSEARQSKWGEMLLSKFPSFDPSWPDEVKDKWFDSFNRLMNLGVEGEIEQ